jgi:putative transposase
MQLRNKTPKRRVKVKLREDRKDAAAPNDVWAMTSSMTNWPQGGRSAF